MIAVRLLALFVLLVAAGPASADETFVGGPCAVAADCPVEFTCTPVEVGCKSGGDSCRCDCPPCPAGEACDDCNCACDEEPADDCVPGVEDRCVLTLPSCEADADCQSPGFACFEAEICEGGGCACPPCADGEDCPPCDCDEPVESCWTEGGHCAPEELACAADADCAHGWECAFLYEGGTDCGCVCPPCLEGEDCSCECDGCDETVAEGRCLPPGWEAQVEYFGDDDGVGAEYDRGGSLQDVRLHETPTCSAAGGTATALAFGAALALLARRRRRG